MSDLSRLTIFFLLFASPAFGESFYVGASVGVSNVDDRASTSSNTIFSPSAIPSSLPINGLLFDSSDSLAGVVIGWNANDWFALELGYADFGDANQMPSFAFSVAPIFSPTLGFPGTTVFPTIPPAALPMPAVLGITEMSLTAKFRKPLVSKLSANWSISATRADFDAKGQIAFNEIVTVNPLEFNTVTIPYSTPKSETGFSYGFGFTWDFSDRIATDVGYRIHDAQVVDIETITLQLIVNL